MGQIYHDKSKSIPMHRVAVVRPFAAFLADIGAPVEREMRRVGLPYSALENADNFVPSQRFWSFLVDMSHREGIVDLGFRVGQRFGANSADPHLIDLLRQALTLYQGLTKAAELVNRTVAHCHMGIHRLPGRSYSLFYHKPSCEATHPAADQIGWFGMTALISMVRAFAGPTWEPAEIGTMTDHRPTNYIREQLPVTRIKPHQSYYYISVENHLLSLPPLSDETSSQALSTPGYEILPTDFVGTFEFMLLAYALERNQSIEFTASLCNMSKRTLQRKLSESGTSYSDMLAQARFRAACQMLQTPGSKVADIAQRLGYSDAAHFARAFRRVAGVAPRAYRRLHLSD